MKRLICRLLPIALSVAVILPAMSASAEEPQYENNPSEFFGGHFGRTDIRTFVELRYVTDIYNSPNDKTTYAALAPQTLEVKVAWNPTLWGTWYLAETWIGDKWIYAVRPLQRTTVTEKKPDSFPYKDKVITNDDGRGEGFQGQLYDDAFDNTKTMLALAPQEVEVIDYANNYFYKIRTWVGDKWVKRNPHWTNGK